MGGPISQLTQAVVGRGRKGLSSSWLLAEGHPLFLVPWNSPQVRVLARQESVLELSLECESPSLLLYSLC